MPKKAGNSSARGGNRRPAMKQAAALNGGQLSQTVSAAPVAVGSSRVISSRVIPSRFAGKFKDAICIEGTDWIGSVSVGASEVAGTPYLEFYVSPNELIGSRLAQFGEIYEKFLFDNLDVEFAPNQPSTQKGSVIVAYDRDISDPTPPASAVGVRQYLAWEDTVSGSVWARHRLRAKLDAPETGFYTQPATGGDDRLAYQGQVYVACMEPTALAQGTVIGDLLVHYRVHFFIPQLAAQSANANISNTGATQPSTADGYRQFLQTAGGFAKTANSYLQYVPAVNSSGQAVIKLAEGLYRATANFSQDQAGAVTPNLPTLTPLEPMAVPAPQATVKAVTNSPTTAVGNAIMDVMLNVPRGGASLSQTMAAVTGMSAAATSRLQIAKWGPFDPSALVDIF